MSIDIDIDIGAIETKLAAARTRLILDKPFLGALVLRLPLLAAKPDWCATTATDARAFYYNPEYIDRLSMDETQFMLAHEALHCALSHFARRQASTQAQVGPRLRLRHQPASDGRRAEASPECPAHAHVQGHDGGGDLPPAG